MKRVLSVVLVAFLIISVLPLTVGAEDVIEISDAAGLAAIASDLTANYKLINNISLSGTWVPIGGGTAFSGTFEGNNKKITGLNVNISSSDSSKVYAGLFGNVSGTVKNLTVSGTVSATSTYNSTVDVYAGGIAGYASIVATVENCINNCTVTASVMPTAATGGWTGYNGRAYAGGVVGYSGSWITISECGNAGEITAKADVKMKSGSGNAYAYAGGIAGYGLFIEDTYNSKNITTSALTTSGTPNCYTGGIAGKANSIKTSCSYGSTISGTSAKTKYVGGIAGELASSQYCYYLSGSAGAGVGHSTDSETPATATAVASNKAKLKSSYTGFDFDNIWTMTNYLSYPTLYSKNEVISGTVAITGTAQYGQTLSADISGITPASAYNGTIKWIRYQWYRSSDNSEFTAIEDATDQTYTVTAADINNYIRVVVRGRYLYGGSVKSSSVKAAKLSPDAPAAPTVASATSTSITLNTVEGCEYKYQYKSSGFLSSWKDGGSGWQSSPVFTGLTANTEYRFYQRYAASDYSNVSSSSDYLSAFTADASGNIKITGTVSITGTAKEGQRLTANTSAVSPSGVAFTYQWYRGSTAITGATGQTYTLTADDVGTRIKLTVTANKTGYTGSLTSAQTETVISKYTPITGNAYVTGTAKVGQTLSADTGDITPNNISFKYQWYRNGNAISGATSKTYKLKDDDFGCKIKVAVTANQGDYTGTLTSAETEYVVSDKTVITGTVSATGTAQVGQTLTANTTAVVPSNISFKYQWYKGDNAISGATAKTYVPVEADIGSRLKVTVTANSTGYIGTLTSDATAAVISDKITITGTVSISGTAAYGETLTANTSGITPNNIAFKYVWNRNGNGISGATASTYKLVEADIGAVISVTVTANTKGYIGSISSASTSTVTKATPATPAAPTVASVRVFSITLTAVTGCEYKCQYLQYGLFWTDVGSWQASPEFTGLSEGTKYRFYQRYAESSTRFVSDSSAYVEVTTASVTPLGGVVSITFTGKLKSGNTLTVDTSNVTPSGVALKCQWYRGNNAIEGANAKRYTLTDSDAGYTFSVKVTPVSNEYSGTLTSAATAIVAERYILGDVDVDGVITILDARTVLRYCVGLVTLTEDQLDAADISGDGTVNTDDARRLLRVAVGLAALPER